MTLIQILLWLGGAAAVALAATLLLPRHVTVERAAALDGRTPADVLALAASNQGYQRFNPYRSADPDLRIDLFGPTSGVGSGFKFNGREGRGSQVVTRVTDTAVDFAIDLGAMGKPAQRIAIERTETGTRVTWSMRMDLGFNPVARVMGLFMDRMVGPVFERGLANLQASL